MFTGLIEEIGVVHQNVSDDNSNLRLTIKSNYILGDTKIGDSIAVNGCCLTVIAIDNDTFSVEIVKETISRTNLSALRPDDIVNLERSLKVGDRLGGHFVQGHIDGIAEVLETPPDMKIKIPRDLVQFVALKGSIAIDGISLTVANIDGDEVSVAIIPHTLANTNLSRLKCYSTVNIEVDVIARYTANLFNIMDS